MTTVTIESVNEWGVKPEGAGWANYSQNYDGPHPLVAGQAYDVDIALWTSKDGTKEKWYINKATPAGETHAPPPTPTALPPVVGEARIVPEPVAMTAPPAPALPPARDETRVSIEKQQALRYVVKLWVGVEGWSIEGVIRDAWKVYDEYFAGDIVPNTLVEQAVAAGDGDPGAGM